MEASIVSHPSAAPIGTARTSSRPTVGGPVVPPTSRLRPLGQSEVTITGGLWADYQALNATVIINHCLTWMQRIGWLGNFDAIALANGEPHHGIEFVDSEVYKLLEAMAWELGRTGNASLATQYDALVARVAAAQDADGYLNTSFGHQGQPARFSDLEWGHELYSAGHLLQAAVARLRTGHDDQLVDVARGVAGQLYSEFGPDGRVGVCGHPEVEVALAEFARATGDERFLELARLFVERRGTGTLKPIDYGQEYFQDDVPVRDATVLRGHAVRALYLAAGAFDVAVDTADRELAGAVEGQWDATVTRRAYITGGVGSHHRDEAFGDDFELPPDRAYSETCAAIASVMLSWRLLLATGDSRRADEIERALLNNILASPREDGRAFFYANTLHQRTRGATPAEDTASSRADSTMRVPWFDVSCCPTNVARTLASVGLYFATADGAGVQLHQYGEYRVDTGIDAGPVSLVVSGGYPFDGAITVLAEAAPESGATVSLRIPGWARGRASWSVPQGHATAVLEEGVLVVSGVKAGDEIQLSLPCEPRITYPDPRIDAVRDQVAVERGPLVLALESVDLPGGRDVNDVAIDDASGATPTDNGATVTLVARGDHPGGWPYGQADRAEPTPLGTVELLPYYRWANRGPSTMRVFIPRA